MTAVVPTIILMLVIPFAAGGFHGYVLAGCSIFLAGLLLVRIRKQKNVIVYGNIGFAAVAVLFLTAVLTPLWAADRGMAWFGILRWMPVFLLAVYWMQCSPEEKDRALDYVPLCGGIMTAVSLLLLAVPGIRSYLTVNGRLAGFFQYPNTFAVFLLAGFVRNVFSSAGKKKRLVLNVLLLTGIVLSGSRTVFVLLVAALAAIWVEKKRSASWKEIMLGLLLALGLGLLFSEAGFLSNADRYTKISMTSGTFLVRLLYFKDALKLIVSHPFGLGYLGYRALEGSIQTGRYYVTYVHNGFLQLLLDFGWIPAILMGTAFLRALASGRMPSGNKLMLALILAHSLLDYDTEFFSVWVILLSLLPLHYGREISLKKFVPVVIACCAAASLWLGLSELCYYTQRVDWCLRLTPFHTDALVYQLSREEKPERQEAMAETILEYDPMNALAWTAKANGAFRRGDIPAMIEYNEKALRSKKYSVEACCNYLDKLYAAMQISLQLGDRSGAGLCASRILTVPEWMAEVSSGTDPLAYRTGDDSSMILPEVYRNLVQQIQSLTMS